MRHKSVTLGETDKIHVGSFPREYPIRKELSIGAQAHVEKLFFWRIHPSKN